MSNTKKTTSVLAGLLLLSSITGFNQIYADHDQVILSEDTCENILGGIWNSATCTVTDYASDVNLRIPEEVTLKIIGKFENSSLIVIDNYATMSVVGWGASTNGKVLNEGAIVNNGLIECIRCGFINGNTVINSGTISNDWKMSSNDTFYNFGVINNSGEFINRGTFNSCSGEVTGYQIERNQPVDIC